MPKAKKLPSGRWRARSLDYIDSNKKYHYRSFTADTKKQAEFMAIEFEMKHKNRHKPENKTVGECIDDYIENRKNILSPSTVAKYTVMRNGCLPVLMNTKVANVTAEFFQKQIDIYASAHAPKTTKNLYALISSALTAYSPELRFYIDLPEKQKPDIIIPTEKQFQQLVTSVKGTEMELPILLAGCGGLRRSEICALTYNDFDFETNCVEINKAVVENINNELVVKSPKTAAGKRIVSLPPFIIAIVKERKAANKPLIGLAPAGITKRFSKLVNNKYRFHDLRHYTASVMKSLNIPDTYAADMLGHSTPDMTRRVYQHIIKSKQQENKIALQNFFATNLPQESKTPATTNK